MQFPCLFSPQRKYLAPPSTQFNVLSLGSYNVSLSCLYFIWCYWDVCINSWCATQQQQQQHVSMCVCVLQNSIIWNWLKMTTVKRNIVMFVEVYCDCVKSSKQQMSRATFHSLEFWHQHQCPAMRCSAMERKKKTNITKKIRRYEW